MSSRTPKSFVHGNEGAGSKQSPPPDHRQKPREKKDDLATFEKTKEAFVNKLWRVIPQAWRIPVAAMILIGGGLAASFSVWYPTVDGWIHPPLNRLLIGGAVFQKANQPCANAEVQLLNKEGGVITISNTDANGLVSFNISDQDRIATLRCTGPNNAAVTLPFDASAVTAGKSFQVFLDQNRIEYHEP